MKWGEEVLDWQNPKHLEAPQPGTVYIFIAASNFGAWSRGNPGAILLSTIAEDENRFVTDSSWKCKGYEGVGTDKWPIGNDIPFYIKEFIGNFNQEMDAVEMLPNWTWGTWGTRPLIQIGAKWIWYGGHVTNNVICGKKIA